MHYYKIKVEYATKVFEEFSSFAKNFCNFNYYVPEKKKIGK